MQLRLENYSLLRTLGDRCHSYAHCAVGETKTQRG